MDLVLLAGRIAALRERVEQSTSGLVLDQFQRNAVAFISQRLTDMERECRRGALKPRKDRYPELSRLAAESDPAVLSVALGGELIAVETAYLNS